MAGEGIGGTNQPASLSVKERDSNSISSNLFIALYQNDDTEDFSWQSIDCVTTLLTILAVYKGELGTWLICIYLY